MADRLKIVVLEGDETGQELLEQACRVLEPEILGLDLELERFDLSLEHRRATGNAVVSEAAEAMKDAGFAVKAATITPEGKDDVGPQHEEGLIEQLLPGLIALEHDDLRHIGHGSPR